MFCKIYFSYYNVIKAEKIINPFAFGQSSVFSHHYLPVRSSKAWLQTRPEFLISCSAGFQLSLSSPIPLFQLSKNSNRMAIEVIVKYKLELKFSSSNASCLPDCYTNRWPSNISWSLRQKNAMKLYFSDIYLIFPTF